MLLRALFFIFTCYFSTWICTATVIFILLAEREECCIYLAGKIKYNKGEARDTDWQHLRYYHATQQLALSPSIIHWFPTISPLSPSLTIYLKRQHELSFRKCHCQHCFSIGTDRLHRVLSSLSTMATLYTTICSTTFSRYHGGWVLLEDPCTYPRLWSLYENS